MRIDLLLNGLTAFQLSKLPEGGLNAFQRAFYFPGLTGDSFFFAINTQLWAQTTSVSGEVTDRSSAALVDTVVSLTDMTTRQALTTTTNGAGRYFFSSVKPGTYSITFSKTGSSTQRIDNQTVDVGLGVTLDATLKVGSVSTVMEVASSTGAELQTMNSKVSSVVSGPSLTFPSRWRQQLQRRGWQLEHLYSQLSHVPVSRRRSIRPQPGHVGPNRNDADSGREHRGDQGR
jgi:Carboxypeptidase regulatory-like domain